MKCGLILLGLFAALAAAEKECPVKAALMKGTEECMNSLNPSQEARDLLGKPEGLENREVQCFHACLATKAGMMDGGKMDIEKTEALLRSANEPDEEMITGVVAAMKECKAAAEISDDECEVAKNYFTCFYAKKGEKKAAESS